MIKAIIVVILLTLFSGCKTATPFPGKPDLDSLKTGTCRGSYTSPNGMFSYNNHYFETDHSEYDEMTAKGGGYVQFYPLWPRSNTTRIDYQLYEPALNGELANEQLRQAYLEKLFVELMLPTMATENPKIIKKEFKKLKERTVLYVLLQLKGKKFTRSKAMIMDTTDKCFYSYSAYKMLYETDNISEKIFNSYTKDNNDMLNNLYNDVTYNSTNK
jgi:hypothetical protein